MGNVLFRLSDSERSSEQIQMFGTPQIGKVSKKDGTPLEKGLPDYLVEPLEYGAKFNEHLDEIQLVDFGECKHCSNRHFTKSIIRKSIAFFVSNPPKGLCTPLSLHPPELVFQHPLSMAVDIWNLGSTVRKSTQIYIINYVLIS
jgi:serine/threonine protein kinase